MRECVSLWVLAVGCGFETCVIRGVFYRSGGMKERTERRQKEAAMLLVNCCGFGENRGE